MFRNKEVNLWRRVVPILIALLIMITACDKQSYNNQEYVKPTEEEYARMTPEERVKEKVKMFHSLIVNGKFEYLSLEIYCRDPNVYFYTWRNTIPGSLPDIFRTEHDDHAYDKEWHFLVTRYDVDGTELKSNKVFLNKLTPDAVVPFHENVNTNNKDNNIPGLDEYVYYIIKGNDEILLEVSMWGQITKERIPEEGDNSSIIDRLAYVPFLVVNGVLIEDDYIFGKIIMPFLSEEYAMWIYNNYNA